MIRIIVALLTIWLWLPAIEPVHAKDADTGHPLDAHLTDSYKEDLDALLERKYIRVLTTYNRTNFFLAGGQPHGFEYALLKEYQKSF